MDDGHIASHRAVPRQASGRPRGHARLARAPGIQIARSQAEGARADDQLADRLPVVAARASVPAGTGRRPAVTQIDPAALDLISRTPRVLRALLVGLPDAVLYAIQAHFAPMMGNTRAFYDV